MSFWAFSAGAGSTPPPVPQPIPRAPLPSLDVPLMPVWDGVCVPWTKGPYLTALPPTPIEFSGNFCGVRVTDPAHVQLPGMAGYTLPDGSDKTLVMNLDIFKYRDANLGVTPWCVAQQNLILLANATRGYKTFQVSLGHAVEQGWTIPEVVALCTRMKQQFGLKVDLWFYGGGWGEPNKDADYWGPIWEPWCDALLAAKCVDSVCTGWQLDGGNTPMGLISMVLWLCRKFHPYGIRVLCHWLRDACAWWDDLTAAAYNISDRFSWQLFMRGYRFVSGNWTPTGERGCDGHHLQVDVNAPINDVQQAGGMVMDSLGVSIDGVQQILVQTEYEAQAPFDDPTHRTELMADWKGRLLGATRDSHNSAAAFGGLYNGSRNLDGTCIPCAA